MHVTINKVNENYVMVKTDNAGLRKSMHDYFKVEGPQAAWRTLKRRSKDENKRPKWDGIVRLMTPAGTLPMGLLPRLLNYLKGGSITIEMDFEPPLRTDLIPDIKSYLEEEIKLLQKHTGNTPYDYQLKCLANSAVKTRSLILSPTSSGKSYIIYLYTKFRRLFQTGKTLIIVPRVTLAEQIEMDFCEFSGLEWKDDCHLIYEGKDKMTDRPVVVSTWQSLKDTPPAWFQQFETLIVDEVHGASAPEMTKLINKCGHIQNRIGLTGTLNGTECHQWQIEGFFGEVFVTLTTKDMIDRGIATPAEVQVFIFDYQDKEANQNRLSAIKDPIQRYREETLMIEGNSFRNAFIAKLALSKAEIGENTLILFKGIEHGKHLHSLTNGSELIYGAIPIEERLRIKELMKKTSGMVLNASYGTFSMGESIPRIHNIICAGNYRGRIKVLQSIGRGLRRHESKELVRIYDFADNTCEKSPSMSQLKDRLMMYAEPGIEFPFTIRTIPVLT